MRQSRRLVLPALGIAGMLALSACGDVGYTAAYVENRPAVGAFGPAGADHAGGGSTGEAGATIGTASLVNPEGAEVGTVDLSEGDGGVTVTVTAHGLPPGFHGLHVHAIGTCQNPSANPTDPSKTGAFLSAGGHLKGDGAQHPNHAGDLPSLLVNEDGNASVTFVTARLTGELLFDEDGSAVMVHGSTDNFANIPQRYAANGPDEETQNTGDAGQRAACAVLQQAGAEGGQAAGGEQAAGGGGH